MGSRRENHEALVAAAQRVIERNLVDLFMNSFVLAEVQDESGVANSSRARATGTKADLAAAVVERALTPPTESEDDWSNRVGEAERRFLNDPSHTLREITDELGTLIFEEALKDPRFRLQLACWVSLPQAGSAEAAEEPSASRAAALKHLYDVIDHRHEHKWGKFLERLAPTVGLRRDVEVGDLLTIGTALLEGLLLRHRVDPEMWKDLLSLVIPPFSNGRVWVLAISVGGFGQRPTNQVSSMSRLHVPIRASV